MPNANEEHRVEEGALNAYDVRLRAVEKDVAVMKTSFATKEDIERVMTALHQLELRFTSALASHREEVILALARQREDFQAALASHAQQFYASQERQNELFNAALAKQDEKLSAALAKQSEQFSAAVSRLELKVTTDLSQTKIDLYTIHMNHMWKLYGAASLLVAGVYFIARYVH